MNYLKSILLLLFVGMYFVACEKLNNKEAGCDVNGIWLGNWEANDGTSGTFFSDVAQNDIDFDGYIFIQFDLPNNEQHGTYYSGRIVDRQAKVAIDIDYVEIYANGNIDDSNTVTGSFDVPSYMSGTFEGRKLPNISGEATEIFSISNCNSWEPCILFVNNKLWLVDVSSDEIIVIDTEGNLIKKIPDSYLSNPATFDGTNLWTSRFDYAEGHSILTKFDTLGNQLGLYETSLYDIEALAFNNGSFYCADNYHRFYYILDASLKKTDSIPLNYYPVESFQVIDNKIVYTALGDLIFKMNSDHIISETIRLPIEAMRSIAFGNNKLWLLAEKYYYPENGPSITDCMVYAFEIEK